ncbi:hypothetical protein HanIR_Chr13g0622351 [Helianthus annuus]|nr:hypothetical protein HanIR_Chr13g0622351 [Helianthus annuus]
MPDPLTTSSQTKARRQQAEHAPCSVSTGPCPSDIRKDKLIEASTAQHGAVPSGHEGVVKPPAGAFIVIANYN